MDGRYLALVTLTHQVSLRKQPGERGVCFLMQRDPRRGSEGSCVNRRHLQGWDEDSCLLVPVVGTGDNRTKSCSALF